MIDPSQLVKPPAPPLGQWLDWLIEDEGVGLEVRAGEPGGAVNMGITQADLIEWRQKSGETPPRGAPHFEDLAGISREDVRAIAHQFYFERYHIDRLVGDARQYVVFDSAFNDGPHGAAIVLSNAIKGRVGQYEQGVSDAAAALANAIDEHVFVEAFTQARLAYQQTKPGHERYAKGWKNRALRVENRALSLIKHGATQ